MKTTMMSTKKLNNKYELEDDKSKKKIWDLEKRGTPTCCICFEIASNPVRIPCRCATLMCLDCFQTFMEGYSACLVCRERIVPRLRRLCKGRGLDSLVDVELQSFIQRNCLNQNKDENSNDVLKSNHSRAISTRIDLKPPDPGELKQELERLNSQFEKERDEEIKASLALIEELKRTGDDDLLELERLKKDEEIALKLQGFAHQVTEQGEEVITIIDEEDDNIDQTSSLHLKRNQSTILTSSVSTPVSPLSNKRIKSATIFATNNHNGGQGAKASANNMKRSLSVLPISTTSSSSVDFSVTKQQFVLSSSSENQCNKIDSPRSTNQKTWTCQVCTYAFTEKSWLRCDMCKSPKHVFPTF